MGIGTTAVACAELGVDFVGFEIGEVEVVHRGPGSSLYKTIQVRPKVKFGNLEDVLVIVREPASSMPAASGR